MQYFIFFSSNILLQPSSAGIYSIPEYDVLPKEIDSVIENKMEFDFNEDNCVAVKLRTLPQLNNLEIFDLRKSFDILSTIDYKKASKASEMLYWSSNLNYCSRCGGAMKQSTIISKKCVECGNEVWPVVQPAIIVLIHKEDEILLVKAKNFKGDYFGLVAGYLETGENAEECVIREVKEETGLIVQNIRYFGTQVWPYPMGLMIGFHADYKAGNIHLQNTELKMGGWFKKDNLPAIPGEVSMARQLIDSWLNDKSK